MVRVDDLDALVGDDFRRFHHAAPCALNTQRARLIARILHHQALDVQDDVGHILHDARNAADLVLHTLDLDAGDRAALQAGEQDAPQAVADGHAEAAFKRLGQELAIGGGIDILCVRRPIAHHTVGQLQATPSDSHG